MLPSVTTVLSPWSDFTKVPPDVLTRAAERGTRVHLACSNYVSGFMVPNMTADEQPYFNSFKRWFDATVDETISVEQEYRCDIHKFIGHPDIVCVLKGDSRICVVDLKTPRTTSPSWRLQLAAYAWLTKAHRCFSLRLSPEGKRALVDEATDWGHDLNFFCNALAVWRYYHNE